MSVRLRSLARTVFHKAVMGGRGISRAERAGPDFIIVGGQRCGTTYLFALLADHPSVMAPIIKEIHYFDLFYAKSDSWYRRHFPTIRAMREHESATGMPVITGEASPYYLFHPLAARRAATDYPNAKIIVLARNPTERAISHYSHSVKHGFETLPPMEAFRQESQRLAGEVERIRNDPTYDALSHRRYSYIARGMYLDQLNAWTDHFPADQILVLPSEMLFSVPQSALDRVCDFLDLAPMEVTITDPVNAIRKQKIDPEVRAFLDETFLEPNRLFMQKTGVDFSGRAWNHPAHGLAKAAAALANSK